MARWAGSVLIWITLISWVILNPVSSFAGCKNHNSFAELFGRESKAKVGFVATLKHIFVKNPPDHINGMRSFKRINLPLNAKGIARFSGEEQRNIGSNHAPTGRTSGCWPKVIFRQRLARNDCACSYGINGWSFAAIGYLNAYSQLLVHGWGLFQCRRLNSEPCPLIESQRILCGLNASLGAISRRLKLVYSVRHSSIDVLSSVGELLGGVGLVTRSIRLRLGIVNQFVGLSSTRDHLVKLASKYQRSKYRNDDGSPSQANDRPLKGGHTLFYILFGSLELLLGCWLLGEAVFGSVARGDLATAGMLILGIAAVIHGGFIVIEETHKIVTQKHLTTTNSCNTVISMANVLNTDKQIGVISALAEGSSIRSIERMTGVHRDTIMRLGVKVGQGCTALMDAKMRDLSSTRLELDEIWGFVGKKDRSVRLNPPVLSAAMAVRAAIAQEFKSGEPAEA